MTESNEPMGVVKAPKLGIWWWGFFSVWALIILIYIPQYVGVFQTISASSQSESWPTVKGTIKWSVNSTSKMSSSGDTSGTTSLSCTYTYLVDGVEYKNFSLTLAEPLRRIHKEDYKDPVYLECKKRYKKRHGDGPRGDAIDEMLIEAFGKPYANEDGSVTVYYDPTHPARSALKPGKISFADCIGPMAVLGFLTLCSLLLMVKPVKVLKWKTRRLQRRS